MNATRLLTLFPLLALLFYLGSSVDGYLYEEFGIPPLYGQIVTLGYLIAYLGAIVLINGVEQFTIPSPVSVILALLVLYLVWTGVSFLYSPQDEIVVDILVNRIRTGVFLLALTLVFTELSVREAFSYVASSLVFLGSALILFDFVQPTFSSVPGRGAGFHLNPNDAGFALVLFGLCASFRSNVAWTYLVWGVAAFGALLTFSRSSWLLLILAVVALSAMGKLGGGRIRFIFLGGISAIFALVFATYLTGDLYLFVARSPLGEFLDPNTLARLGAKGVALDDYSSIEREDVLALGIEKFVESPFIGHGVGYTHVWEERVSTHNMLALLGAELGIIGIALYVAIFAVLMAYAGGVGRIIAAVMFIAGMATHNQLDDPTLIIPLSFAIASIPTGTDRKRTQRIVHATRPAPRRLRPA